MLTDSGKESSPPPHDYGRRGWWSPSLVSREDYVPEYKRSKTKKAVGKEVGNPPPALTLPPLVDSWHLTTSEGRYAKVQRLYSWQVSDFKG